MWWRRIVSAFVARPTGLEGLNVLLVGGGVFGLSFELFPALGFADDHVVDFVVFSMTCFLSLV